MLSFIESWRNTNGRKQNPQQMKTAEEKMENVFIISIYYYDDELKKMP